MDGLTLPLVDDAALHDQIGTGHHGDVLQRITVKGHQVGILAGLQRTDVPSFMRSSSAALMVALHSACMGVRPYSTR